MANKPAEPRPSGAIEAEIQQLGREIDERRAARLELRAELSEALIREGVARPILTPELEAEREAAIAELDVRLARKAGRVAASEEG